MHRAESKNLCTVIISGFNVEPLYPMNGPTTYHTSKYIGKKDSRSLKTLSIYDYNSNRVGLKYHNGINAEM